ncbi:MAG: diacylglycerol kinase [Deltaproteobacteria bacterium]|nr:diacylglycerol kinase [Deltaproteobacteria bacterium]
MQKQTDFIKPKGWISALNCAVEGVILAFRRERHVKVHFAIAAAALFLSLFLKLPITEFVLFALSIVILLFAEMMNTAVEEVVNLLEEKKNVIAKNAKDISAGAVLISSFGVAITVYMVFSKYLYGSFSFAVREAEGFAGHIAVISLLIVLISVIAAKATSGKHGRPLRGGMPSGHAAVAFSLFTSISILTLDPFAMILAFVLALMVSSSRLMGGIHTRLEIFLGALLGAGLTLLIYKLFLLTLR